MDANLLATLAPRSRAKYQLDLEQVEGYLASQGKALTDISPALFVGLAEARGWKPTTTRGVQSALRWFLRASGDTEHPFLLFKTKRVEPPPGRVLTADEFRALLKACPPKRLLGARDLAMFMLMAETGVRASEVCSLRLSDLDLDHGRFTIIAKGNRRQAKQLSALCVAQLEAWLDRRSLIAKPGVSTVFVSVDAGQPLTRHGLGCVCRRAAKRAGIPTFRPHALRRTFATEATRNGCPLPVLMRAGGWSSMPAFSRYVLSLTVDDFSGYSPVTSMLGGVQ